MTTNPTPAPLSPEREPGTEYGIRIPNGSVLMDGYTTDRADQTDRLARYRDCWPDAVLVQRTVRHGEWTEAE